MFLVEIGKAWHRLRTWVLGAALAAAAVLPVVIVATSPGASGGPPFLDQVRHSGLFGGLAAVGLIQPVFLPLGAALLAGEAVAAEASAGTLRYLLVRPVGRVRLVLGKFAAVMAQLGASVIWVALVGIVAGGIAFGFGRLPTLSGATLSSGAAALRILAAAGYVVASAAVVAAIGMLISTLTDSAPGAIVATFLLYTGSQIVDGLNSLRVIHPYLFTHGWLAYADLFRSPVEWSAIVRGLEIDLVYTIVFVGLALAVFDRRDIVT